MSISRKQNFPQFVPLSDQIEGPMDYQEFIIQALSERRLLLDQALHDLLTRADTITAIAKNLTETLASGSKVLVAGNGGSAAEAQHFTAELVGRFKQERNPYAVLALSGDTSTLTAVANDYGYQEVFARQLRALAQPGDLFFAFSTSGQSKNVLQAAICARRAGMSIVALTGDRPSGLEQLAHITLRVPTIDTAATQELHMVITHILCDLVESYLTGSQDVCS